MTEQERNFGEQILKEMREIRESVQRLEQKVVEIQKTVRTENAVSSEFKKAVVELAAKMRSDKKEDPALYALVEQIVEADIQSPQEFFWKNVLKRIRMTLSKPSFETWFSKTSLK